MAYLSDKDIKEICETEQKLHEVQVIIDEFFSEESAIDHMNDYVLCYTTLGKIYDTLHRKVREE